ncbi:SWIM zinc finger family protein [Paenibacillus apis]|uniref:SWIM-type domain-containing protein n=1 Tax=Paenibacillus apis TaxID=1792174 RepID=A0A919XZM1_9BACL|nr:hypothetical protein [Paenibacillus apis]GIO41401.1 hypothetical protein J41TS4_11590 [Paenibacillus apis]
MNLKNFEKYVSSNIVNRGKDYYLNDHVINVEEMDDRFYRAEVEGSEYYEVAVRIGTSGEIQFISCDCPFDMEAICKHEVAVLMELRSVLEDTTVNRKSKSSRSLLSEQLNTLSKEQLVSLLTEYALEMREVKNRLDLYFMKSNEIEDMGQYVKIIRTYVKMHSERDGFVTYRNVSRAVVGAEEVLEKAWQAEDKGKYLLAAQISFCVMDEMADLMQSSDDSDGTIGGIIEDCLQLTATLVESADLLSPNEKQTLLHMLLQEAQKSKLGDWDLQLLEIAVELVNDKETRQQWEDCVRKLEQREHGQYENSYFTTKVALLKYHLICQFDGEQSGAQFLQAHMELPDIREMAIREAISQGRFEEALSYAKEGELLDTKKGYPGLVARWKKLRLDIYNSTGGLKLQQQLTEEFAVSGEYEYYLQLKDLYEPEEWPDVYSRVLAALEKERSWRADSMYTKLLIAENETTRLLEYIQRHPGTVVDYYKHLIGQYPSEVYELFEDHIESTMAYASNRKQYKQVCQIIRKLLGAGGRQQGERIMGSLRQRYANRPAFLDELNRIDIL